MFFVRLFDLRLSGFVYFLFCSVFGKGCGLRLWHSLDFSLIFFLNIDSEGFLCLIIIIKKTVLIIMLQSVFFDIISVRKLDGKADLRNLLAINRTGAAS